MTVPIVRSPAAASVMCSSFSSLPSCTVLNCGSKSELMVFLCLCHVSAHTRHTWRISAMCGCRGDITVASHQHHVSSNLLTAPELHKNSPCCNVAWCQSVSLSPSLLFCTADLPVHPFTCRPPRPVGPPLRLLGALTLLCIFHDPSLDIQSFVLRVGVVQAGAGQMN